MIPPSCEIPIGPTGILVGAALCDDDRSADPEIHRDDLIMWALTDPQRATRIVMDTSEFYVRQLLIRAAAVGERIAIYSNQPRRWLPLSQPNIAVVGAPPRTGVRAHDHRQRPAHHAAVGGAVIDGDHPGRRRPRRGTRPAVRADLAVHRADHHRRARDGRGDRGVPPGTGVDGMSLVLRGGPILVSVSQRRRIDH